MNLHSTVLLRRPARSGKKCSPALLATCLFLVSGETLVGADVDSIEVPVSIPFSTVSADFDADGRTDFAVLRMEPWVVTVFRSEADRTFTSLANLELGFSTETLFAHDLDGDGASELVAGNYPGRFALVFWNDGSGGFAETAEVFVGVSPRALAVVAGDASLELAAAGGDSGQVALLTVGSDRRFGAPVVFECPVELPHVLTAADLNGDGRVDLAVWGRSSSPFLAIMERGPRDDFAVTPIQSAFLDPGDSAAPVVLAADVDGDRTDDLLWLVRESPSGGVGVGRLFRLRRTAGRYEVSRWGVEVPLERTTALLPLAPSPDGPVEVAIVGATATGGLFAAMPNPEAPGGRDRACTLEFAELPRAGTGVVSAGDFDRDGHLDIAVPLEHRDSVVVLYNPATHCTEAESCYVASPALEPAVASPFLLAFDRFGSTPEDALAIVGDSGGMLLRPGVDGFARGARFATPAVVHGIAAADLDGDGSVELILSDFAQGAVEVIAFAPGEPTSRSFALPAAALPEGVDTGDLDRRGGPDLAVALRGLDAVAVLLAEAGGGFAPPLRFPAGERPRALALGDVDGDGRVDIAVTNDGSSEITLLLAEASEDAARPLFQDPLRVAVPASPQAIELRDLDGNGRADPVVLSDDGSLTVLRSFEDRFEPLLFRVPAASSAVAFLIADLDNDDLEDIAVATVTPPALALFRGDDAALLVADGTVPLPRAPSMPHAFSLTAADLHVDGLTDIGIGDPVNGTLTVLRPLGCAVLPEAVFRRGDVDQNGRLEVTDSVRTLNHLFLDAGPLACPDAADSNDDGTLDLTDAVTALTYLFLNGPALPAPAVESCGEDPTEDALAPCEGACSD